MEQYNYSSILTRRAEWKGDVLHVSDMIRDVVNGVEQEIESNVLNHFDMDFTDLREYLRDKEEWKRKQAEGISHWISVTDKLPKVGQRVLVYAVGKIDGFIGESVIEITERIIFRLIPSSEGVETWGSPYQYFMTDYEITHWMPLPEPPKEDGDGEVH